MIGHNTLAVFRFELRRTITLSRLGVWVLLVLFPIFIVSVMKYYEERFEGDVFGRRGERPIELQGVTIDLAFRHGRREATVQLKAVPGSPKIGPIPIPQEMSREELAEAYPRLVAEFLERRQRPAPSSEKKIDDTVWGWVLLGLIPGVTTLLGLLLWATPIVQAELESRTWGYVAVRPRGRASVLLGKYLTAVAWTTVAGWTSATVCILIAQPKYPLPLWSCFVVIVSLACAGYGALYSLIGVCIQRRAMVIAVAYTLIFEFLISFVPAVINQFTIQYRLRNLLVLLMGWRDMFPEDAGEVFLGNQPTWLHLVILASLTMAMLIASVQVIQRQEYVTAEEA